MISSHQTLKPVIKKELETVIRVSIHIICEVKALNQYYTFLLANILSFSAKSRQV